MVIRVASKGIVAIHAGKDVRGAVKAEQAEGLIDRMRPGVEQAAAPVFLTGLPVPTPRKPAP